MYFVKEDCKKRYKIDNVNVKVIKELGEVKKDGKALFKIYKTNDEGIDKMDLFEGGSK